MNNNTTKNGNIFNLTIPSIDGMPIRQQETTLAGLRRSIHFLATECFDSMLAKIAVHGEMTIEEVEELDEVKLVGNMGMFYEIVEYVLQGTYTDCYGNSYKYDFDRDYRYTESRPVIFRVTKLKDCYNDDFTDFSGFSFNPDEDDDVEEFDESIDDLDLDFDFENDTEESDFTLGDFEPDEEI